MLNELTAISPVDGRYRSKTEKLADYFSEQALIRYRIRVEVEYFIALCRIPLPQLSGIEPVQFEALRALYRDFSPADAARVKEIEAVTNHDVKAVEYIIKEKMDALGLERYKEFVHFGLTSQDINNTAIPLSLKEALAAFVPEDGAESSALSQARHVEAARRACAALSDAVAALSDGMPLDVAAVDLSAALDALGEITG